MKNRREFLKNLATVGGVTVVAVVAPKTVERQIVKDVVTHRAVYSDVFVTHGDGTKDGDMAMIKLNEVYRSMFRKNGRWGLMFQG